MSRKTIPNATTEPRRVVPGDSAIEARFARIARELVARWNRVDIDDYLDSLLIDTRGNRMGFPPDVLEEIMFLAGVRWYMEKTRVPETQESPQIVFSFYRDETCSRYNGLAAA
jgi:hypothetical protein